MGGSFNPAHEGHRAISLFAIDSLELDEFWWMVSPGNPLKSRSGMAPFAARLASGRAAMSDGPPAGHGTTTVTVSPGVTQPPPSTCSVQNGCVLR